MGLADDGTVLYDTKNVEDIKVGDLVYSYDTITGEYEYKAVTETFVRKSDHINYLTIVDENGSEQTIETTDGHPFWVVTDNPDLSRAASSYSDGMYHGELGVTENGYWVEAKDLRVGDVFLGADGQLSILTGLARVEQSGGIDVFNFTVEGNHNYFVLEKDFGLGQTCVLVHNALDYTKTPVFRGGAKFKVRKQDITTIDDMVQAGRGVSANLNPNGLKTFGGAFQIKSVPSELEIIQTAGTHCEIVPKTVMLLETYQNLLNQIMVVPWP